MLNRFDARLREAYPEEMDPFDTPEWEARAVALESRGAEYMVFPEISDELKSQLSPADRARLEKQEREIPPLDADLFAAPPTPEFADPGDGGRLVAIDADRAVEDDAPG